jgi:urate oxidase
VQLSLQNYTSFSFGTLVGNTRAVQASCESIKTMSELKLHQHGKSRVRLGRTWREGSVHHFVEWMVHTMLESDMELAFTDGDNTGMTATDTQKNTVRCCCSHQVQVSISSACT